MYDARVTMPTYLWRAMPKDEEQAQTTEQGVESPVPSTQGQH